MSIPFWIAMAGWLFTYANSRSLARQSEANSIGAAIDKMLQEIADENYKFWRDTDSQGESYALKCQLFQSYISFRCDFIEERVEALSAKCRTIIFYDGDVELFEPAAIALIGSIREVATLNSEEGASMSESERRRKILVVNKHTLDLHGLISRFISNRYRPIFAANKKVRS